MLNIANKLTVFRILLVPFFVFFLMQESSSMQLLGAIIFTVAATTDFLDGYLARSRNLVTTFGKFADPLADKILTMSAFVLLVEQGILPAWGVIVIISREFIVTGFRILAASNDITIAASPYGKAKTIAQLIALIWILFQNILPLSIGIVIFYISLALTVISGIDYLYKNREIMDLNNL